MSGESVGTEEARLIATIRFALPGVAVNALPARIPKGFSAESWRVETSIGALVVKVQRRAVDGAKLHGQAEAVRLTRAALIPTAEFLYAGASPAFNERAVVILRFVPGTDAEGALPGLPAVQQALFFADLGDAVGRLHGIALPHFTERLGMPQAAVQDWYTLIDRNSERAARWNRDIGLLVPAEIAAIRARLQREAAAITAVVTPALTHRDLYLANVLLDEGRFAALLDFELAKGYDPLLDFVKLGMFVFEDWPAGIEPFMRAYRARVGPIARFAERVRVCFALEQFVMLPNWVWSDKPQLAECSGAYLRDWLREVDPWWLRELSAIAG